MATILVVAESPDIEALLGDLVIFAGYNPVFVRDDERPCDTMRRRRVDALLFDAALPIRMDEECSVTAEAQGAPIVYCASTMSAGELRAFAEMRGAAYFPLPNGPRLLARVLGSVLKDGGRSTDATLPPSQMIAAMRAVARARQLGATLSVYREDNQRLRDDRDALLAAARASRELLHAAVLQFITTLRADGLPREDAIEVVNAAVHASVEAAGAPELLMSAMRDAEEWVGEAYSVA